MPIQDINFSNLTSVIYDGVGLTEVKFNDTTIFTDPNPILSVGAANAVSVDAGIRLPDYSFSADWALTDAEQKYLTHTIVVRVYNIIGQVISGTDISYSFASAGIQNGTIYFSGSFGTLVNTSAWTAFIDIAAGNIFSNLQVVSPTTS